MESQNNIDTCSINNITFNLVKSHTDKNIIKVSSKREIFFDVFECIVCDGQTLVLEKVDEVDMLPIVNVEFILDGKIYTCEAVLIEDSYEEFVVNEDNILQQTPIVMILTKSRVILERKLKILVTPIITFHMKIRKIVLYSY